MEIQQYLKFRRSYERVVGQLLLDFQFFTEDSPGINIYSVQHRLKTFESAYKKALSLRVPITDLHDIAGLRIVVATAKEIEVVARFFYRKADSKDLQIEFDRRIEREDGYRARHLLLKLGGHYSRSVHETTVEVQLHTLMEHAYNYISRAWIYKGDRKLSDEWRNEFLEVSGVLTDLDLKITKLQTEVLDSAVSGNDNEPLTAFSYQRIVGDMFGEQVSIDEAVDTVQMLIDLQCDTNGLLRRFFSQERVLQLRERFVEMLKTPRREIAEIALDMSLSQFYLLWGIRIEGAEKFLTRLEANSEKLPGS